MELLDEQAECAARKLRNEPELHADGGQALYNALPRELQRTFAHLASLMRDADEWPPAALITSVAQYHQADVDCALCLMGSIAARELTDTEAQCVGMSKQLALALSYELEVGEPAELTSAVRRPWDRLRGGGLTLAN